MEYQLIRTCKKCKNEDVKPLDKMDAAFEERRNIWDFWNSKCSKCGSIECFSVGFPTVKLDGEILNEWGYNDKLHFMSQDEEILLAEIENLDLILSAIDDNKFNSKKIKILIESLCVLLYDNAYPSDEFDEEEESERQKLVKTIKPELLKRKEIILQNDEYILDYVKEVVFPLLNVK